MFRKEADKMRRWFSEEDSVFVRLHQNEGASSSINPELWATYLQEQAAANRSFARYPEMQSASLTKAYAAFANVPEESVLLTSGSGDGIRLIADALDRQNKTVAIMSPSFFFFEYYFREQNSKILKVELDANHELSKSELFRPEVLAADMLILCNPNNPTGGLFPRAWIEELLKRYQGILLVDEAYIEYTDKSYGGSVGPLVTKHENLIVLRTLSKAWGLASARVGFIIAHPKLVEYFGKFQPPYSISAFSQSVAELAVTRAKDQMLKNVKKTIEDRVWMEEQLRNIPGVRVFTSSTNFVTFGIANAVALEASFQDNHQVLVKAFPFPNAGPCIRLSISADRAGLERALKAIRAAQSITK